MLSKKSALKILFSQKISTNAVVISEKLSKVYSRQVELSGDIEDLSQSVTIVLIQRSSQYVREKRMSHLPKDCKLYVMRFLEQVVHKLFSFLCLFYTQKGIDTRIFKFEN